MYNWAKTLWVVFLNNDNPQPKHPHHTIQNLMSGRFVLMGVMGEFETKCLRRCYHFPLAGTPEDRISCLFCLFGDITHGWFDIPATGVLQAAGRNSGFYPVKTTPLRLETSQPMVDFILNSMGVIFGVWCVWGALGEHIPPAWFSPASTALPSLQPLEMIILHSPTQIKALPSLPIILMDFMLLFKLHCFQTGIHLNVRV